MFLLHFLPTGLLDWIINGMILVGIVGVSATWIARYIPIVAQFVEMYRLPIQIISVVLLVTGVYWKGGESVELAWRDRVAEMQKKIEQAEAQSKEANKQLQEEIRKTQKLTKEVNDATKAGIKANAAKMDSQCTVDSIAIGLHNGASLNQIPRGTGGTIQVLPNSGTSRPVGSSVK